MESPVYVGECLTENIFEDCALHFGMQLFITYRTGRAGLLMFSQKMKDFNSR